MRATCATFVGVDDLISVVVVAIRLRVMAQIVCGAAGVARAIFLLSRACFHIWFHMCIRVCYVVNFVRWGENLWGTLVCGSLRVPRFLR